MRLLPVTALLLAASVHRPGCGSAPPEPPVPCILAPNPCGGKACGVQCAVGGGCGEAPSWLGRCDAYGECIPSSEPPPACGPSAECAGRTCGTACDRCAGSCSTPIAGACDYAGWCAAADLPWLCYDPCQGKTCGASCAECPAGDPSCVETAVQKACDAGGHCVASSSGRSCPP